MATILLVDDVELFLELERSFLEGGGHEVVTASSGEEALARLDRAAPDLLLLDLYMPGIDGDEVCRRLRASERWRKLPVIMVTAAGKEEDVRKCLSAGCDDYVTKPIRKKELMEKVQRLLGGVRGRTAPRTAVSLRVQIAGDGKAITARAQDISRNGIYVRSRTLLAPGAVVELRLELPGGEALPVLGKVVRVQQGPDKGMGIYFIHPEPQGVRVLETLAARQGQGQGRAAEVAEDSMAVRLRQLERQNAELAEESRRLHRRVEELELENREFAEQIVQTEEVNNNLTNLYIASSRLHSVLRRPQVLEIIKEVVINFVGAEKFALLLPDGEEGVFSYAAGEGFAGESFPAVAPEEGGLGSVLASGESFFTDGPVAAGSDDPLAPLAAVPLRIQGETLGVLAIYRLFIQKERFAPVDYQLFSMLAEHAATALFSSSLYEASERKRKTYRGLMDLLLK